MDQKVSFSACEHLDYDRNNFVASCSMNLISHQNADKVVWDRETPDGTRQLVQFCKKRGRLNCAVACLGKNLARCSDYTEHLHEVPLSDIAL